MKQAIHLFKKDFRRLWPMIAGLLIFLALQIWLLWKDRWAESAASMSGSLGTTTLSYFMTLVLYLMLMVMTVLLIQEDPPVGKPFWLARPIYKKSLLAAKCSFILLFGVVVPLAANFIILFHYGLEPQRILSCLIDSLSVHLALVFIFFAIAVLTPVLSNFFMAVLIWLVLFILSGNRSALEPFSSQVYVSTWLGFVLCFIVILYQYMMRRRALAVTIFIAGMMLIAGTDLDWHIAKTYRALIGAHDPEVDNLRLAFQNKVNSNVDMVFNSALPKNSPGKRDIIMGLDISNIQPSSSVVLLRLKGMLLYDDGARIPLDCAGAGFASEIWESEIIYYPKYCQVNETVFNKYGTMAGDFSGEAVFKLIHYTTDGRLPLKQGSLYRNGSQFLSVSHQASSYHNTIPIILRGRSLASSRGNLWAPITTLETDSPPGLLLAPRLKANRSLIIFGGPVLEYSEKECETSGFSKVDSEMLSHMEILIRSRRETGPFVRKFEEKNVRLADYTKEEWRTRINQSFGGSSVESPEIAGSKP
jgi:hypothetical protein